MPFLAFQLSVLGTCNYSKGVLALQFTQSKGRLTGPKMWLCHLGNACPSRCPCSQHSHTGSASDTASMLRDTTLLPKYHLSFLENQLASPFSTPSQALPVSTLSGGAHTRNLLQTGQLGVRGEGCHCREVACPCAHCTNLSVHHLATPVSQHSGVRDRRVPASQPSSMRDPVLKAKMLSNLGEAQCQPLASSCVCSCTHVYTTDWCIRAHVHRLH